MIIGHLGWLLIGFLVGAGGNQAYMETKEIEPKEISSCDLGDHLIDEDHTDKQLLEHVRCLNHHHWDGSKTREVK